MIGFGIDEIQAEYVAEIKLRHLNREYILKRIKDIEQLENEIVELEDILSSKNKMKKLSSKNLNRLQRSMITAEKVKYFILLTKALKKKRLRFPIIP